MSETNVTPITTPASEQATETEEIVAITFDKRKIKRIAVRVAAATAAVAAVAATIVHLKKDDNDETPETSEPLELEWMVVEAPVQD